MWTRLWTWKGQTATWYKVRQSNFRTRYSGKRLRAHSHFVLGTVVEESSSHYSTHHSHAFHMHKSKWGVLNTDTLIWVLQHELLAINHSQHKWDRNCLLELCGFYLAKDSFRHPVHYWKYSWWLLSIKLSKLRIGKKNTLDITLFRRLQWKKKCGSWGYISW